MSSDRAFIRTVLRALARCAADECSRSSFAIRLRLVFWASESEDAGAASVPVGAGVVAVALGADIEGRGAIGRSAGGGEPEEVVVGKR